MMKSPRSKSIALGNGSQPRVYRTFEDWESEQQRDTRTPEERGIKIGSSVMWRHKHNGIIVTDRATVTAISDNKLTLLIKDVKERTTTVDVREVVSNDNERA
jgi:hypothetical protein